ncbi:MAG TPA: YihY family inner membrane protein [Mizugakiibacter sp.]|nr:YihY family inner membrane protein [Mizugakiibacter sp.]
MGYPDPDRVRAFASYIWQRFLDERCFETAGALAFTTIFALVPLLATVFGILSLLPVFSGWSTHVSAFVFRNFVPAAGVTVQEYLLRFAANANRMTLAGAGVLLLSALMMMAAIENRFDRIWRVRHRRRGGVRFLLYWAALTLGPLLVIAGVAVSSYLLALPWIANADRRFGFSIGLLEMLPSLLTWVGLMAMYTLIPNRRVALRHAAIGALLATLVFAAARLGFVLYVTQLASYRAIYGALAAVPIFLIWVYLSWVIVMAGASLTASLASFIYRPAAQRLPGDIPLVGLLHLLQRLATNHAQGKVLTDVELHAELPFLTDDLLQRYLGDLETLRVMVRTDPGEWILARDPAGLSLGELVKVGGYRLPTDLRQIKIAAQGLPVVLQSQLLVIARQLEQELGLTLESLHPGRSDSEPER